MTLPESQSIEGILPLFKPAGMTSFAMIRVLRRVLQVKKIGHAGTLDPFATGVMILLVGRTYTRLSDKFLNSDKEYEATIFLGAATDSYDCTGEIAKKSDLIPSIEEVESIVDCFQGDILQTPPMYSAKKVQGKKLYELARKGVEIERKAVPVSVNIEILSYSYPHLKVRVRASKGTYIRSLAHDIGEQLGCYGHLETLCRTRSGQISLKDCLKKEPLSSLTQEDVLEYLRKTTS